MQAVSRREVLKIMRLNAKHPVTLGMPTSEINARLDETKSFEFVVLFTALLNEIRNQM